MVQRLVISLNMSLAVANYLKERPEAGVKMVNRIISEIDSDKRIKLLRNQVLVVLGKAIEQNSTDTVSKLLNWSIAWNYSYITSGERPKVTKVMDKAINRIIKMAMRELLWKLFGWEYSASSCNNEPDF